ncbi:carbohydrate ABC transporter permease [Ectobacillus ponti]|uniref:Sugar ABC transporter permease n=1 Tax=Ectobacillus ponti TaxID=2961894 RepID=A0AA41X6Y4_9BACI|nr:sugar ABC transporter permease [Ectobacillus ponti]MCP8967744.1 sugar ABC transporter permease [Ectobacillus ponti]
MKPWLFLLPALAIYIMTIVLPGLYTLYLSFFKWNGVAPQKKFVGLSNYINLFTKDKTFLLALRNNVFWTVASMVIMIGLGLMLAVILNRSLKGRVFFRGVFYFPYVLSNVVVALIWGWLFHPTMGLINSILGKLGLESLQHAWLSEPKTALSAVFIAATWQGVGMPMILFLAGLQSISKESYEAAVIDGAKPYQMFWYLTIPMLSETFIIVFATTMIASMKVYDIIYAMTGGGPAESTQVLSSWMYYQTFKFANVGIGSAISWVMVLITMMFIVPYVSYMTKNSHVDS